MREVISFEKNFPKGVSTKRTVLDENILRASFLSRGRLDPPPVPYANLLFFDAPIQGRGTARAESEFGQKLFCRRAFFHHRSELLSARPPNYTPLCHNTP
jgi:hypothetical protein